MYTFIPEIIKNRPGRDKSEPGPVLPLAPYFAESADYPLKPVKINFHNFAYLVVAGIPQELSANLV